MGAQDERVVYLEERLLRWNKRSCVISELESIREFIVRKTVPTFYGSTEGVNQTINGIPFVYTDRESLSAR